MPGPIHTKNVASGSVIVITKLLYECGMPGPIHAKNDASGSVIGISKLLYECGLPGPIRAKMLLLAVQLSKKKWCINCLSTLKMMLLAV